MMGDNVAKLVPAPNDALIVDVFGTLMNKSNSLHVRIMNCFRWLGSYGIITFGDLRGMSDDELLRETPNFGCACLKEIHKLGLRS